MEQIENQRQPHDKQKRTKHEIIPIERPHIEMQWYLNDLELALCEHLSAIEIQYFVLPCVSQDKRLAHEDSVKENVLWDL